MMKYCYHGGRIMLWLPYHGWDDITGTVNVTYYRTNTQLAMHDAWRKNNPKNQNKPYCVIARMGNNIYYPVQSDDILITQGMN